MIAPLPQLKEIRLDGNDISIVEKNAMNSAKNLKNLTLRDNPLACDCKLQYFAEWLNTSSQLVPMVRKIDEFWMSSKINLQLSLGPHGVLQDTTVP